MVWPPGASIEPDILPRTKRCFGGFGNQQDLWPITAGLKSTEAENSGNRTLIDLSENLQGGRKQHEP